MASASEGETAIAITPSAVAFGQNPPGTWGAGLSAELQRGLTPTLWLRGTLALGYHVGDIDLWTSLATVGVTYALDVITWVPSLTIGAGVGVAGTSDDPRARPVIEVGVGLDRLLSRSWSAGVQTRLASFGTDSAVISAGLRLTYRWGFF
jgi:hypothetical protein